MNENWAAAPGNTSISIYQPGFFVVLTGVVHLGVKQIVKVCIIIRFIKCRNSYDNDVINVLVRGYYQNKQSIVISSIKSVDLHYDTFH